MNQTLLSKVQAAAQVITTFLGKLEQAGLLKLDKAQQIQFASEYINKTLADIKTKGSEAVQQNYLQINKATLSEAISQCVFGSAELVLFGGLRTVEDTALQSEIANYYYDKINVSVRPLINQVGAL